MRKRSAIKLISYFAAAALVFGAVSLYQFGRAEKYKLQVETGYYYAFAELAASIRQIDESLHKGIYATSPGIARLLCADISAAAVTAQMSLNALPFGKEATEQTSVFLSRTGDYTSVLQNNVTDSGFSDNDREILKKLWEAASFLSRKLSSVSADINSGSLIMDGLYDIGLIIDSAANIETAGSALRHIDDKFPQYPTLYYDGQFSGHIANMQPKMLENAEKVTESQARRAASNFLGLNDGKLYFTGMSGGDIPAYVFCANVSGSEYCVSVSAYGGKVISLLTSRGPGETVLTEEEALSRAKRFLELRGVSDMREYACTVTGGEADMIFVCVQNEVVCYPDSIRVRIAMDTGSVIGYDAGSYLRTHRERDFPPVSVSADLAEEKIAAGLTVQSYELALISSQGRNERLCHEFKCRNEAGQGYTVYISAQTGEQERILLEGSPIV